MRPALKESKINYYEHHINDYAEATAHLTFVEDAAYGRMIRKYYALEKPLPAEIKAVQRLVGARTKDEREAVGTVLEEFFTLQDDGWHNARCDEEVEKFQSKQPNAEAKKGNERERQRRSRERRKALFDDLRSHGVVAPWDATNEQLHAEMSRVTGRDSKAQTESKKEKKLFTPPHVDNFFSKTESAENIAPSFSGVNKSTTYGASHAPVTRDNTGTQTPDTRHQSPDTINTDDTHSGSPTRAGAVCVVLKSLGIANVNPQQSDLLELLRDGAEIGEFESAGKLAVQSGKGFAYVLGILKNQKKDAALALQRPKSADPKRESFRERDARVAAERVAEFSSAIAKKTNTDF